jgi:hypothetical protein
VESASGVAEPVLARRQLAEVGRRLGDLGVVQLEDDAAGLLSADFDVELHSSSGVERADRRNRAYVDVGCSAITRLGQNTVRDAKDGLTRTWWSEVKRKCDARVVTIDVHSELGNYRSGQ